MISEYHPNRILMMAYVRPLSPVSSPSALPSFLPLRFFAPSPLLPLSGVLWRVPVPGQLRHCEGTVGGRAPAMGQVSE